MASHANIISAPREMPASFRAWSASIERPLTQFLVLVLAAWLLRQSTFGHPNFFIDEAFYFAAGIEMSQGAVPFIDIWDRKPWGHFALFAGFAAISHNPAIYQIAATVFAAATAFFITRFAASVAPAGAATASGLAYLLFLPIFSGAGGQSPVFYNAFIAASALLIWKGREGGGWQTPLAMLLAGMAITIKTSAVFDGIALGLVAVWFCWQRHGSKTRVLERALFWAIIGAAPSLIIALGYWMSGYWTEFWQAMALSNLDKSYGFASSWERALTMITRIAPLAFLAAASWPQWKGRRDGVLVLAWLSAALAGLLAIPNFYAHYALPLLMPLCVLAAPFFARIPIGPVAIATLFVMSAWMSPPNLRNETRDAQTALARLAFAAESHGAERGVFNYDGPLLLNAVTGTRPLSPLMFGPHLSHAPEADVSHLDTSDEVARVLALKPGVVVMAPEERHLPANKETRSMVLKYIADNCREVAIVSMPMRFREDDIAVYGDCESS